MRRIYKFLLLALSSWLSLLLVLAYCFASFYFGQIKNDMNLFAASGAVMTVFGLLSIIRFTTIEKYLNQETIITNSTGVTGPPLSAKESKQIQEENRKKAKARIKRELHSELKGISLTVIGTLIWAYGNYVPIFEFIKNT